MADEYKVVDVSDVGRSGSLVKSYFRGKPQKNIKFFPADSKSSSTLNKKKYEDIQKLCKKAGIDAKGKKDVLISRLLTRDEAEDFCRKKNRGLKWRHNRRMNARIEASKK